MDGLHNRTVLGPATGLNFERRTEWPFFWILGHKGIQGWILYCDDVIYFTSTPYSGEYVCPDETLQVWGRSVLCIWIAWDSGGLVLYCLWASISERGGLSCPLF